MKLYDCVQQALIKIKMSHLLEPVNRDLMLELVQALEPKKVCVMEISRSDADLMSADIALEFIFIFYLLFRNYLIRNRILQRKFIKLLRSE